MDFPRLMLLGKLMADAADDLQLAHAPLDDRIPGFLKHLLLFAFLLGFAKAVIRIS